MSLGSGAVSARALLGAVVLAGLTSAAYLPSLPGEFLIDDYDYVARNPVITAPDGWITIWLGSGFRDYYALTHTSFWLEWRLWGNDPGGYRAVNIALHVLNATLVWRLLWRLHVRGAFVGALLFALHPANVQAVAWISQRKTLLAACFGLLSVLAWLRFRAGGPRSLPAYAATLLAFLLGLLSKLSVVVVPLALPLIAWWQSGRLRRDDLLPLLPLFLLAGLFGATGLLYESNNPMSGPEALADPSVLGRASMAGRALWFYLATALWPHPLTFLYPAWEPVTGVIRALAPAFGFALLLALTWWQRQAWGRTPFAVLLWFAVALGPVLGFLDFGHLNFAPVADMYLYLSLPALCGCLAAGFAWLAERRGVAIWLIPLALIAAEVSVSRSQAGLYQDREGLYLDTLAVNPGSRHAHNNLGTVYLRRGAFEPARQHYESALAIQPDVNTHANLGLVSLALADLEGAERHYRNALALEADHADSHAGLGNLRLAQGNRVAAERHYRNALEHAPRHAEAHGKLANLLEQTGRQDEAYEHLASALKAAVVQTADTSELSRAHRAVAAHLANRGDLDTAIWHFRQAVHFAPHDPKTHANLGVALASRGDQRDLEEAVASLEAAVAIDPGYAFAKSQLTRVRLEWNARRRAPAPPEAKGP